MIYIFLMAMVIMPTAIQAQETPPVSNPKRVLEIYIQANTGNVNPNALPIFAINFSKYGLKYFENLAQAPWFSWYLMLELKTDLSFNYLQNNPKIPGSVHMWNLDEYLIEAGFSLGNNFILAFNNLGRFDIELYHIFRITRSIMFRLGTELELLVLGGLLSAQPVKEKPMILFDEIGRPNFDYIVNYFGIYATLSFSLGKGWMFFSQLNPRFIGDDAKSFVTKMQLRWNNGFIYYSPQKGWSIQGVMRYQAHNLHMPMEKVLHNILFIGGVTKFFDFTK
ncbi:MAG: hypothetical protein ACRCY4_06230 [Brevinema sp.]